MDMWGVGCVFFEIVNRAPLFPGLLPPFRLALNNTILLGILACNQTFFRMDTDHLSGRKKSQEILHHSLPVKCKQVSLALIAY